MFLILATIVVGYVIYSYFNTLFYWKRQGVPHVTSWPFFGSLVPAIIGKRPIPYVMQDIYDAFPNKRYMGFHNLMIPHLLIRDPDLIKRILIKELDTFPEHREFIPDGIDTIWSDNVFAMRGGPKWHNMRTILSPAFTASKLKTMFELIKECSKNFSAHYLKQGGPVIVDLKDPFSKYANDIIATVAFGLSCDSHENKNNDFIKHGEMIVKSGGVQGIPFYYLMFPTIATFLKLKMFPKAATDFFKSIISEAIKFRVEKSIKRPDMLNLLIETKKKQQETPDPSKPMLTDHDITAQALAFYFAGFDSTSTMMSHAGFELAINPEIQDKLREEVDEAYERCNGDITYEAVLEIKYLDMILSETLRKWPPFILNDRVCKKPFTIDPEQPGEQPLNIEPGTVVVLPIFAIQRDPQYFQNPEKFDPERFNENNKHTIHAGVYAPFGAGPRNCIGMRLALLEAKLILCELIRKFEIIPTNKTKVPIQLKPGDLNPLPIDGFWVELRPRQNQKRS